MIHSVEKCRTKGDRLAALVDVNYSQEISAPHTSIRTVRTKSVIQKVTPDLTLYKILRWGNTDFGPDRNLNLDLGYC